LSVRQPFPILDRVEGRTSELLKTILREPYVSPTCSSCKWWESFTTPDLCAVFTLVQREPARFDLNLELAGDTQDGQLETPRRPASSTIWQRCSARLAPCAPAGWTLSRFPEREILYVVSHVRG